MIWHPLSEVRPFSKGVGKKVLCANTSGGITIETTAHVRFMYDVALKEKDTCFYTHWMKLPELPSQTAGEQCPECGWARSQCVCAAQNEGSQP